jgi:hypothetical protein
MRAVCKRSVQLCRLISRHGVPVRAHCDSTGAKGEPQNSRVLDRKMMPAARPLAARADEQLRLEFEHALQGRDALLGAHCIHELWMRGALALEVEHCLERLWQHAAGSIPEWLPMRHFDALELLYRSAQRFRPSRRGRSNLYLVLLDYRDCRGDPYGIYVGMSHYSPAQRFDQHKAGIRAAGSVLRRGLEVLVGPVLHLQKIGRTEAGQIEAALAEVLREAGLRVQGGH